MTELAKRRRALMAQSDDNPVYTSSKGKTYHKFETVTMTGGVTIPAWLDTMGLMENLEELTFTGRVHYVSASGNVGRLINAKLVWSTYAPNLAKLKIIPKYIGNLSSRYFDFGHYSFSGLSKMNELQLGGLSGDGYCYFNVGGYFRDDNGTKTVGTSAGLHLNVYRTNYNAMGGFGNGTKAASTVVTCYNKDTGEVMTA